MTSQFNPCAVNRRRFLLLLIVSWFVFGFVRPLAEGGDPGKRESGGMLSLVDEGLSHTAQSQRMRKPAAAQVRRERWVGKIWPGDRSRARHPRWWEFHPRSTDEW
jgi:hypothetical protein